jgi:hypothetical protein
LAHPESFALECFFARACPPSFAHCFRCSGVVLRARALPPRLPSATA